jgi:hypothetical protein
MMPGELGYVRRFVPSMLPWSEFVDDYQAAGGWNGRYG